MDPLDPILASLLQQHWGFSELRPLQGEAVAGALSGRDGLVILPTGGGKSLCYQLPALAQEGLTVVVSPLLALIQDQVDGLRAMGIEAAALTSVQDAEARSAIRERVRAGELKLLYVAPEGLVGAEGEMPSGLRALLADAALAAFAIDEAHCISQWGHEYRPAYRRLALLRKQFPGVPIRAFTATATEAVRRDIVETLGLRAPQLLVGDFDRPNLTYRAIPRSKGPEQVLEVIAANAGQAGIIYCNSRKEVETLAQTLAKQGVRVRPYHAGLDPAKRQRNQAAFASEAIDVIVATVAFGMGIDRSNVRFVVHTAMPKALEAYQQEAGRAGRDGLPAVCVLLHGAGDGVQWRRRMEGDLHGEALEAALARLAAMEAYATTVACRHRLLVGYFDQEYAPESCGACDVCLGEQKTLADADPLIRALLSGVVATGQRFGAAHVVDVLRGARSQRVLELRHDALSCHGSLARHAARDLKVWLGQLAEQGLLERRGEWGVLALTPAGQAALEAEAIATVRLTAATATKESPKTRGGAVASRGSAEQGVFEALRDWRRALAAEWDVAPYMVLPDTALWELVDTRPASLAALRRVKGIGDRRAERLGSSLLEALAAACAEAGLPLASAEAIIATTDRGDEAEVFAQLKRWRLAQARERGVPPFMVFADAVLKEVARRRPPSRAALLGIKGIGERKLEEFGDALLAALAEACGASPPASALAASETAQVYLRTKPEVSPPAAPTDEPANRSRSEQGAIRTSRPADGTTAGSKRPIPADEPTALSRTEQDTLTLLREGHAPAAIAGLRKLQESTIYTHLRAAIEAGQLGPEDFLPADTRAELSQAAGLLGPEMAWAPMRALLPVDVPDGALTCWLAATAQADCAPSCPDPALAARCQALLRALEVPQAGLARRLALTLNEPAQPLRALAAYALGRLGGEQAGAAVQQALSQDQAPSSIVAAALLRALGDLGRGQAIAQVRALTADTAAPPAWQALARKVLQRLEAASEEPREASAF
ncbi:MAG: RecQ family ATP-dependent DNA helicase [Candidatus Sericytochromatia bacterium]|nr:RecQ family ATP-dependent DNA helicase [Candidatus Sericytochromatia bacterium]